jgi:ribonuclease P protein component
VSPAGTASRLKLELITLQKRRDFVRVQQGGRRFRRERLIVLVDAGLPDTARVGYTVSRRVGNAVVRNRVRRRLREIVRLGQELLVPGFDYVLLGSPQAAVASYAQLEAELLTLLEQARSWASAHPPAPPARPS